MKKIITILLLICFALPAVAKKRQNEEIITPLTHLEKRQFQTRTYNTQDKIIVMKAVLNTLQDEGFIVYNVNSLLGFIYGVKDFNISDSGADISAEFGLTKSRLNYNGIKVATLETAVNFTEFGENIRVRINFKRKLLNEYGNAQFIDDISDGEFYANFYEKLEKSIAIQKQFNYIKNEPPVNNIKNDFAKIPAAEPKINITKEELPEVEETEPQQNELQPEKNIKPQEEDSIIEKENTLDTNTEEPETDKKSEPETTQTDNKIQETQNTIQIEKTKPEINILEENIVEETSQSTNNDAKELKELIKQVKAQEKQAQKAIKKAEKEAKKASKQNGNE